MNFEQRKALLKERKGLLGDCNLWTFWDGLTNEQKSHILDYFENTPLMFDYTNLFKGDCQNDFYHGILSVLMIIFVRPDLNLADYFYAKFSFYNQHNYNLNSKWGLGWEKQRVRMIQIWQKIIAETDKTEVEYKLEVLERIKKLSMEDIYWNEAHSFVQLYSAVVYKAFLHGECNIDRFENAFQFCYNNIDRIKIAITNIYGWDKPLRNAIVEQYLVHLEKNKQFDRCIEIIEEAKNKGWNNDFEKRLKRCLLKKDKMPTSYGK